MAKATIRKGRVHSPSSRLGVTEAPQLGIFEKAPTDAPHFTLQTQVVYSPEALR